MSMISVIVSVMCPQIKPRFVVIMIMVILAAFMSIEIRTIIQFKDILGIDIENEKAHALPYEIIVPNSLILFYQIIF